MGNSFHELNERIQEDKKNKIHSSYINEFQSQSNQEQQQQYQNNLNNRSQQNNLKNKSLQQREENKKLAKINLIEQKEQQKVNIHLDKKAKVMGMSERNKYYIHFSNLFNKIVEQTLSINSKIQQQTSQTSKIYEWKPVKQLTTQFFHQESQITAGISRTRQNAYQGDKQQKKYNKLHKILQHYVHKQKENTFVNDIKVDLEKLFVSSIEKNMINGIKGVIDGEPKYNLIIAEKISLKSYSADFCSNLADRILYLWRKKVSQDNFKHVQQYQLPIVSIYQYNQAVAENKTIDRLNNILTNLFKPQTQTKKSQNQHQSIQGQDINIQIYLQHIPYRLSHLRTLTNHQGIYVLQQALKGFMILYDLFGQFQIQSQMIGFTWQGKVKVWISPIFHTNFLRKVDADEMSHQPVQNFITKDQSLVQQRKKRFQEEKMVGRIYMLVQKYALFSRDFIHQSRGFRNCSFEEAIDIIERHKYEQIVRWRLGNMSTSQKGLDNSYKFVDRLNFNDDLNTNDGTYHWGQLDNNNGYKGENMNLFRDDIKNGSVTQLRTLTSLSSHINFINNNANDLQTDQRKVNNKLTTTSKDEDSLNSRFNGIRFNGRPSIFVYNNNNSYNRNHNFTSHKDDQNDYNLLNQQQPFSDSHYNKKIILNNNNFVKIKSLQYQPLKPLKQTLPL